MEIIYPDICPVKSCRKKVKLAWVPNDEVGVQIGDDIQNVYTLDTTHLMPETCSYEDNCLAAQRLADYELGDS